MSEHGGIQEREEGRKRMPIGMSILFMGLILCGLIYLYRYLPQTSGWTQVSQYEQLMKAHETSVVTHEETAEPMEHEMKEAETVGQQIFASDCAMCHGKKLEGGIGPALTGPKFIYGNTLTDHIRIITDGTQKGMPGFKNQLGAEKIHSVAQYIYNRRSH